MNFHEFYKKLLSVVCSIFQDLSLHTKSKDPQLYVEVSECTGSIWCREDLDTLNFLVLVGLDELKCESAE